MGLPLNFKALVTERSYLKMAKTVRTIYLKEAINKAELGYLKQLEKRISFLEIFSRQIKDHGLQISVNKILGFSPRRVLAFNRQMVLRAKSALYKIEDGSAVDPVELEDHFYYAMKRLHCRMERYLGEIDDLPSILEEEYGYEITLAAEAAEREYAFGGM